MKETEDNTNRQKDILCSQTKQIYIVKMTILPKDIYKFNATPNTLSVEFFFSQNQSKNTLNLNGNVKDTEQPNNSEKEKQNWNNQNP